ncbi:rho GTPase-activating protein 20-like [Trachinotus anak]|uniref:rho GTPase-activating protein 20-like n=1 Tax=Trachinotus anak TaxID=443729 RepID=UPI0039F1776A
MSPQQQQDSLSRGGGQQENKRRMKSQSYRRQSAPSLVITKALTRSKTLSRESFLVPVCPETCQLVQSFLGGSDRSFLLHGHAQLKTGMQTQDRHLFLFNDILVIAKAKSANHFKQKAQVCVCEMWTAGCMDEVCEGTTNPERSFVMGWPTCNCVATFSTTEQKERWYSLLRSRIKEDKEKEEPKTIPLRVYGKGLNSYAVTKTLPVSNWDSTNEVIRLALQQFSIIGNVKDYQLWVISKRDNAPYPLIETLAPFTPRKECGLRDLSPGSEDSEFTGQRCDLTVLSLYHDYRKPPGFDTVSSSVSGHEFPFSIQMSHVRHNASQGGSAGGRDAAAPPADRQKATQVEQLQVYRHCQFILKPRPVETQQQHASADLPQKPFKRRRSLITWAFWRGSSSHLNELSLAGAPRGRLFGQPLGSVCVEDALPKPVMDMLAFLYHEGSWTRGIFRRPAGARAVRELRDTLDAGEFQLPLTRDHVFIIAGVFKDFLRSIPGSLLCCELHEEWMDVLEEEEEEKEQVEDIQRMICRLPKANALLLRYLLALLHGIQGNAHENQMTSFNISVCIAPSMLWPPGAPRSPEVEGEGAKRVCELVKFMIEHCRQILGEDPSSLFGGPPQRPSTDEMGSDSWMYPLTDSSYDSLENELDNSSGGSPGFSGRGNLRAQPLQGSTDSILTFSDYDQDTEPDIRRPQTDDLHTAGKRQGPGQAAAATDASSALDSLCLDGLRRQRRRSEPAIAYVAKFGPRISGSADGLTGEDEDGGEALSEQTGRGGAAPEASSSTPSSPDSPSSDHTRATRRGLLRTETHTPSNCTSGSLSTFVSSALTSGGSPHPGTSPRDSPPKEPLNWGTLKGCRGLHPNSWLKKDRRLSLTQQDNLDKEEQEEDQTAQAGPTDKTLTLGKVVSEKGGGKLSSRGQQKPKLSRKPTKDAGGGGGGGGGGHVRGRPGHEAPKPRHLKQDSYRPPSHHRSTGSLHDSNADQKHGAGSETNELKQSGPSLSLFKRHKSHSVEEEEEEEGKARLYQRRGSEPGRQVAEQTATLDRARLPSDPGLKVSEADTAEARFCLSPYATKAVREYFSSHPRSNPQSSRQVALALVESRREWLKRCSDPTSEPDFDQLLFAEESYV